MGQFTTFREGFAYELANRDFARIGMTRLAKRTAGRPDHDFWASYARLEDFNVPLYRDAARRMGFDHTTSFGTKLRGYALGAAPRPLLKEVLRTAYPRTVEYLEDIHWMRSVGPAEESSFLQYMDEQEEVQVDMMNAALRKDYDASPRLVSELIAKWDGASRP